MNIEKLMHNIWLFFCIDTEDGNCRVCERPEYLDCIDDELCGRAESVYRRRPNGNAIELLKEIIKSPYLSDRNGDESGGHLLSEARAFLRKVHATKMPSA